MKGFCLLLTVLFDQQMKNVNNYFVGVVLLQHGKLNRQPKRPRPY